MSLVAAIGYAIGIFIFAVIIRRYRKQLIKKYMATEETKRSQSGKESQDD